MSIPFLQGGRRLGLRETPGRTLSMRCEGRAQALSRSAAAALWRRFTVLANPCDTTTDHAALRGWTIGTCIVRKVTDWLEKCLRSRIVATFCPKMTAFGRKRSGSEADNTCKRFRESDNKGLSLRKRPPAHENRTSKPSAPGPRKARMSSSYGSCRRARQCITGTQGRPRACLSNGWPDAAQFRRSR